MWHEQGAADTGLAVLRRSGLGIADFRIGLAIAKGIADQAWGTASAPGRGHKQRTGAASRRVIGRAGTRALAQLEKRVHANGIAPVGPALFRLELPDDLVVHTAQAVGRPSGWHDRESGKQPFGDRWLDRAPPLPVTKATRWLGRLLGRVRVTFAESVFGCEVMKAAAGCLVVSYAAPGGLRLDFGQRCPGDVVQFRPTGRQHTRGRTRSGSGHCGASPEA
jgi:hypothetical protein